MPKDVEIVEESQGPDIPTGLRKRTRKTDGPFYAWSRFPITRDRDTGFVTKWAYEGDEVTPDSLGLTQEQFDEAFEGGSIREEPYPVPENMRHESPHTFRLLKERQAADLNEED